MFWIILESSMRGADTDPWLLPAFNHSMQKVLNVYNLGSSLQTAVLHLQGRRGHDVIPVAPAGRTGKTVGLLRPRS